MQPIAVSKQIKEKLKMLTLPSVINREKKKEGRKKIQRNKTRNESKNTNNIKAVLNATMNSYFNANDPHTN